MAKSNIALIAAIILVLGTGGFLFYQKLSDKEALLSGSETKNGREFVPVTAGADGTATKKNYHQEIDVDARSFFFSPDVFSVKKGEKVTVRVHSYGDHAFAIDELKINKRTPNGETTVIEFTPQKEGAYRFYCPISGHTEAGMSGVILVE